MISMCFPGMTPLHKALLYGQTNTVRYLLAKYPQCVNATDYAGRTPLHYTGLFSERHMHRYDLFFSAFSITQ